MYTFLILQNIYLIELQNRNELKEWSLYLYFQC